MELNKRLVTLRKKKGLSQAELAEAIKVSRQAISRWEVGSAIPSADNLMWLSKFYEVSMDELMGVAVGDGQEKSEEKPTAGPITGVPKKFLILMCVLIAIAVIAIWAIFPMLQGTEKETIALRELESKGYMSGDIIDMDIKPTNS